MAGIGQYLKDTQGELRHVAWPTRTQTIVYTVLVFAISVIVALYLGLFDFLFTSGLKNVIEAIPASNANPIQVTQQIATSSPVEISTPVFSATSTQ